MKSRLITLCCLFFLLSCTKEEIKQKQEDTLVKALTSGQWKVTTYIKGGTDISVQYVNYKFQFKSDNTVDAIFNSSTQSTGTWSGNIDTYTFTANFTNAATPILQLNGTWQIINSNLSITFVEAQQSVSGELRMIRLDKL